MGRFGNEPVRFFEKVYEQDVPWEIGGAQPALLEMIRRYPAQDPILDVGCGSGDTCFALARMGHKVVGVDFVKTAISLANERLLGLGNEAFASKIEFLVGNGLQPQYFNRQFGSIVDSGFLHLFDEKEGKVYLNNLKKVLIPRGKVYFLEFAIEFDIPNTPRAITKETVHNMIGNDRDWKIKCIESAVFQNKVAPVQAIAFCIEKT